MVEVFSWGAWITVQASSFRMFLDYYIFLVLPHSPLFEESNL